MPTRLGVATSGGSGITLYVNAATGDDARSYATAQNSATPWLTIGRACWGSTNDPNNVNAATAVQAGDTVSVAAGTYWENGLTDAQGANGWTVALNPANSGTVGNPITFQGVGDVYIRLNENARGPMIGSYNRDYIIWDNFIVDDYYGGSKPDTGPVSFSDCSYCQLINSTVIGLGNTPRYWNYQYTTTAPAGTISSSGATVTGTGTEFHYFGKAGQTIRITSGAHSGTYFTLASDTTNDTSLTLTTTPSPALSGATFTASTYSGNYRLVALERADHTTIKNNTIYEPKTGIGLSGAILTYGASYNTIEHNEVYGSSEGIYLKGLHSAETQEWNVIRYNLVHDIDYSALHIEIAFDTLVYQNIVYNADRGLYSGGFGSTRTSFVNNTCYNITNYGNAIIEEVAGWEASNNYAQLDYRVVANGNVYQLITAGTSAGSGGPSGTGADITDGTAHWEYVAASLGSNDHSMNGSEFKNNLFHTVGTNMYWDWAHLTTSGQVFTADRNFYYGAPTAFAEYGIGSFANWQADGFDTNSSNGTDPQFVNAAGHNFHLASNGQTSLTAGRVVQSIGGTNGDTIPVGAYISGSETIGVE